MGTGILLLLIAFAIAAKGNGGVIEGGTIEPEDGEEPDFMPGPVVRPIPAEPEDQDETDDMQWLANVEALISDVPTPGRFYQIQQGDLASTIAGRALGNNNTGSNRVALVKCMTRVGWNDALYVSDRHPASWGTLFDVDGLNLSAAFLPRHASAVQAMANRQMPPRTIDMVGNYTTGQTGYFGLLWVPPFTASANAVVCDAEEPPAWLMDALT